MNNVNNIEFHPTVSRDLECYNVSFLKLLQLLAHGDVESNPGPLVIEVLKGEDRRRKRHLTLIARKRIK